jgi:hypothetical protein
MVGTGVKRQQLTSWFPANLLDWVDADGGRLTYSSAALELGLAGSSLPLLIVLSTAFGLAYAAASSHTLPSQHHDPARQAALGRV